MMKQWIRFLCLSLLLIATGNASAQNVAKIGDTEYETLQEALTAASNGATVELLKDEDLSSAVTGTNRLPISKSLTINGNNHVITMGGRGFGVGMNAQSKVDVTFKDVTILNKSNGARCIDTRGNIGTLTLDGVTLNTQGASGCTQPLTIGGNQSDAAIINIKNSTIQTNEAGTAYYAITTFNPVNMTISNSTIKGWACIYAKGKDGSAGSAGSVFTIENNSKIISSNAYSGVSNTFAAFSMEDNNVSINVKNSEITINNTGDQTQALAGYSQDLPTGAVTLDYGTTVNFAGPQNCALTYNNANAELNIVGGTYNFNPSEFLSDGYKAVEDNGIWTVKKIVYVAQIDETKYESLQEAVAAANDGDVVEIIKAGDYTLPNISKNVTIEGKADGAVSFTHTTAGSVASIPNGATFKNVTFNFGNVNYHGFQHAGTINMEGCTLNGLLFSYSDMNFTNCTFGQSNKDYHMWCYAGNVTYNSCTFTNSATGKFLNIYNEDGATKYTVTVNNCKFVNNAAAAKAALNVKATCGSKLLAYDVIINECTTEGAFPEASSSQVLVVLNNLVQVDDRTADGVDNITVTQDGKKIYPVSYVAQIGETKYESLQEAVAAATAEATTITLLKDVKEGIVVKDGKNIVLDLNGKTMTGGIDQYDADIVVKNGTLAGTVYVNGAAENMENYNKFTLDATATIITKDYGIILWQSDKNTAYGSTIDINGTINGCVFVMGNIKEGNSVINVNDGATIKGEVGIALNGYATLNVVDGATIEGTVDSGIEVRAGKLNVTGGKISSTASEYTVNPNGSGTTTTGAAIAVAQHTTKLATDVVISGGELSGVKTISVADPENKNLEGVTVKVANALANAETVVIPEGYKWVSADGMSTLTKKEYVAQIGEVKYETLAEAVAAADTETTTITLLKDVKEGIVVKDGKNIVLDLKGKTMTGYIDQYDSEILVQNGTLAGTVYVNGGPASAKAGYNKFTLAADATITADWGFMLYQGPNGNDAYGSVIDINGIVNGTAWVMGNITEGNSVINVNNGAKIEGSVFGLNGYATLNVNEGATIIGSETGIEVRAGKLNVMGGTITSTASEYTVVPNGSGTTTDGAAIAVAQHTTGLATEVNISGGEFAGVKSLAIVNPQNNTAENVKVAVSGGKFNGDLEVSDTRVSKFVSGGIYSKKPDEKYCAEGYIVTDNTDEATKSQYPFAVKTKEEAGIYELIHDVPFKYVGGDDNAKKITYTRTFEKKVVNHFQTWYVPFDYTISNKDLENFEFYKIHLISAAGKMGGEVKDKSAIYIYVQKVGAGTKLSGNRPYVLKAKSELQDFVFEVNNTKLYAKDESSRLHVETTDFNYDFYGNYDDYSGEPEYTWYTLNKDGQLQPNSETATLRSYRWYIKTTARDENADYAKPNFFIVEGDGETDGINNAQTTEAEIEGIYTLGGIKVEHLVKGVNIIKYTDGRTKKINVK